MFDTLKSKDLKFIMGTTAALGTMKHNILYLIQEGRILEMWLIRPLLALKLLEITEIWLKCRGAFYKVYKNRNKKKI